MAGSVPTVTFKTGIIVSGEHLVCRALDESGVNRVTHSAAQAIGSLSGQSRGSG